VIHVFTDRIKHPKSRNLILEDVKSILIPIPKGIQRIPNLNEEAFIYKRAIKGPKEPYYSIEQWIALNVDFGLQQPNFGWDQRELNDLCKQQNIERKFKFVEQTEEEKRKQEPSVKDKYLYMDFVKWYREHYYPIYKTVCPTKAEFSSRFSHVTGLPLLRIFDPFNHVFVHEKEFVGCTYPICHQNHIG